ncbi:hypothetical protein JTE90_003667 [Oedothorax gibbosus]|uniref:Large ribosomal subunit protein mL37 n=1 Tax=Oedothorax gibbosus TaxID=931172 RepID=A0AAV6VRW6_9ARAC|nr:hypothetical protein JTE90_003667 [Oedothorax gibbosus]
MRFSQVLCQINYYRHFQRIWKRQGKLQAPELKIPEDLLEMKVPIRDAREILQETKLFPTPLNTIQPPRHLPPSVFKQEKCFYVMNSNTQVSENENQALSLTKTVPYKGLPSKLVSTLGKDSLPNQDELVQKNILQALVWDGDQFKLPRKDKEEFPPYIYKRAYGTLNEKKVSGLLEKLTFLGERATGKYPACLHRNQLLDTFCELAIQRHGDHVTFQLPCDVMLTSNEPLKQFASAFAVGETAKMEVPNIYPIKPTLDLDKVYSKPNCYPMTNFNNRHLHSLFLAQKSTVEWLPEQMLSQAIATCFAFAAKEAQMKYGVDVKLLPEPISVQCMYMDIKTFNFIAYQLNTLDLENNEGIKNQMWVDEPAQLYENVSETELITNYNPQVFPKLLAFYLNGLLPSKA